MYFKRDLFLCSLMSCMRDKLGSSSKRGIEYERFETNWSVL